jgi:hypothetical protein
MPRKYANHADNFSYIDVELTFKSQKRNFTPFVKKYYELYFGGQLGDFNKS